MDDFIPAYKAACAALRNRMVDCVRANPNLIRDRISGADVFRAFVDFDVSDIDPSMGMLRCRVGVCARGVGFARPGRDRGGVMDEYRRKILLDNAVEMYDLLKEHQWSERDGTTCPECWGKCPDHEDDCRLAAVLVAVSPAAIVGSREPFPPQVKKITGAPNQPPRIE